MDTPTFYRIRIKGHLDEAWNDWFEDLKITNLENGEAELSGILPDQAALQGVLNQISSLGLALISVNTVEENDQASAANQEAGP